MADVKWIKIVTDIFDDEKILLIESMPDSDAIIVCWFKLLCLAGKINNGGVMMLNDKIAYTDEMLSTIFRRPVNTVRLALRTFEQYEMIEVVNNTITIPNWRKHQTLDQLEEKKNYMRGYMRKYREEQKLLAMGKSKTNCKTNCKTNSKANVSSVDIEREEDKDKDKEYVPYKKITDAYNETCQSLPRVIKITETRKKHIAARWKEYDHDIEIFKELFTKAEQSDFLTLRKPNERNWKADFDWLMNQQNMAKVLEDKYINKQDVDKPPPQNELDPEILALYTGGK